MAVLNTTSPTAIPSAPIACPVKVAPSAKTKTAGRSQPTNKAFFKSFKGEECGADKVAKFKSHPK